MNGGAFSRCGPAWQTFPSLAAATLLARTQPITADPSNKENYMVRKIYRSLGITIAGFAVSLFLAPVVHAQSEQQVLIGKAQTTLSNFMRDPEMSWIQKNLPQAKGVLVTPEIVK